MNRETFLKQVCPTMRLALMASVATLESCSKTAADQIPQPSSNYDQLLAKTLPSGYFVDGKLLYINLQKEPYSALKTIGSFVNDETNGVLILRKSETLMLGFDNCCPHQGTRNRWSFSNNRFTCGNHGYVFGTETGQVAPCNSNSQFGNLKSYSAEINKDLGIIQLA